MYAACPDSRGATARMVPSLARCYSCGFAFNLLHYRHWTISAIRRGPVWRFLCPNCRRRVDFNLSNNTVVPSLPTFRDTTFTTLFILLVPAYVIAFASLTFIWFANTTHAYLSGSNADVLLVQLLWLPSLVYVLLLGWYYRARVGMRPLDA